MTVPILVGPAGWSYADWEGIVYPKPRPRKFDALTYLAQFVDCIELNTSFYRIPQPRDARSWVRRTDARPSFRFTAKLFRGFTHDRPSSTSALDADVEAYRRFAQPLVDSGKLSAVLVQFPLSYRDTPAARERLDWIGRTFADLGLVVELRHASWFHQPGYDFLASRQLSLATVDLPAADDHPPASQRSTGPIGYLRLHGRNSTAWFDRRAGRDQRYDYLYAPTELDTLVERAKELTSSHETTFVITNNHFEGKAVANAIELAAALGVGGGRAPAELLRAYPRLGSVAVSPPGQGELF